MPYVLMMDDGEAFGPYPSALAAIRADVAVLATHESVFPEYRERAGEVLAEWPSILYLASPDVWDKAKVLIADVDHAVFEVRMVVGEIGGVWDLHPTFELERR